jgi:succinate dehydrogenase / fumarate reductase membrane anchor subunit
VTRKASGFHAWVVQRVSAIYLALGFIYLAVHFLVSPPQDFTEWKAWLSEPLVNIGMGIFFLALLFHAWIGIRDIVIDYVHPLAIRLSVLTGVAFMLLASGFWLIKSLIVVVL